MQSGLHGAVGGGAQAQTAPAIVAPPAGVPSLWMMTMGVLDFLSASLGRV